MSGQEAFSQALLDPEQAVPNGLIDPTGRPAGKRFAVYRNNVAASLTDALQTAFPLLNELLGEQNFRNIALLFLRQHPPSSPLLMFYGAEMPAFLSGFPPVSHLPYLPDVARLELAIRHSYHAADRAPITPEALTIPAEQLMAARLRLAPAVQLVQSQWPVHGIWAMHQSQNGTAPAIQPETILITRPEFDPVLSSISDGERTFVQALIDGETFGKSVELAEACDHNFDLTQILGLLLSGAAITGIKHEEVG